MSSAKFFVWARERWRELELSSGGVAGWRGRARFVVVRRGRLRVAPRRRVLAALRAFSSGAPSAVALGPRLSSLSKERKEERVVTEEVTLITTPAPPTVAAASCMHQHSHCCAYAHRCQPCSPAPLREPLEPRTLNLRPLAYSAPAQGEPPPKRRRPPPEVDQTKQKPQKKPSSREVSSSETEQYKELTISESDVLALRSWVAKSRPSHLYRFDADDKYKRKLFYAINPLVDVRRCDLTERLLKERRPTALPHFAARLGLTPTLTDHGSDTDKENRIDRDVSDSSDDSDVFQSRTKKKIIAQVHRPADTDSDSDSDVFQKSSERSRVVPLVERQISDKKPLGSRRNLRSDKEIQIDNKATRAKTVDKHKNNKRKPKSRREVTSRSASDTEVTTSESESYNGRQNDTRRQSLRLKKAPIEPSDEELLSDSGERRSLRPRHTPHKDTTSRDTSHARDTTVTPVELKSVIKHRVSDSKGDRKRDNVKTSDRKRKTVKTSDKKQKSGDKSSGSKRDQSQKGGKPLSSYSDSDGASKSDNRSAVNGQSQNNIKKDKINNNEIYKSSKSNNSDIRVVSDTRRESLRGHKSRLLKVDHSSRASQTIEDSDSNTSQEKPLNAKTDSSLKGDTGKAKVTKNDRQHRTGDNKRKLDHDHSQTRTKPIQVISDSESVILKSNSNKSGTLNRNTSQSNTKNAKINNNGIYKSDYHAESLRGLKGRFQKVIIKDSDNEISQGKRSEAKIVSLGKVNTKKPSKKYKHEAMMKVRPIDSVSTATITAAEVKERHIISKRVSNGKTQEYSNLEDHCIVSWVSGDSRATRVNGNALWRELQEQYQRLTGRSRSWHSLRNRYLRYVLPALGSLHLPPSLAARLRASAARGNLKARRAGLSPLASRRNSIFEQSSTRSASSRGRPEPEPEPEDSMKGVESTKSPTVEVRQRRSLRSLALKRSPSVSLARAAEGHSPSPSRSHSPADSRPRRSRVAPPGPPAAERPRTRKLFNPKLVL